MKWEEIMKELETNHGYEFDKSDKHTLSWLGMMAEDVYKIAAEKLQKPLF